MSRKRRSRAPKMTFADFAKAVASVGLNAVECSPVHWQIRGGVVIVNYYPTRGTVYFNGAISKDQTRAMTPNQIVELALNGPSARTPNRPRKGLSRQRASLFAKTTHCHWCGKAFANISEATVEHLVPRSRGGSDRMDNLRLACEPCNRARRDSIDPPTPRKTGGAA